MNRIVLSLFAFATLASGCTEDTVPTVDTKVDKNEPVAELDEPTEQELCDDLEQFTRDYYTDELFTKIACISVGVYAGADESTGQIDEGACQRAYDACLDNPPADEVDIDTETYTCDIADIPAECSDLTVGDIVDCTEEAARFLDEYINDFSCSKIGEISMQTDVGEACTRLEQKCPGLYEDDTTSEPTPEG